MAEKRHPRRELMPLAPTQLKVVTVVCLPLVLGCLITAALQTYFFLTSLKSSGALESQFARTTILNSLLIAAITLFVMVPVFILLAVWLSYRIVGPMRRFAAELKSIGEGRLRGGFHFRDGDELVFVAQSLAEMKQQITDRLTACRDAFNRAEQATADLASDAGAESGRLSDLQDAIAQLREQFQALELPEPEEPAPDPAP